MSEPVCALGIVGSPRQAGNTDVLVQEILAGAGEAGARTEIVRLRNLRIEPCQACNACRPTGRCVMGDDMPALFEQMRGADIWVLGTPVYWWGPTAQFKAFLDRWYAFDSIRGFFHGRRVAFAIPSGGGSSYAHHTAGILEEVAVYLGMDHRGTLLAGGAGGKGAVRSRADLLHQARDMGRNLVR